MEFGKRKLKILYLAKYQENISTWKIERVVRKHKLFQEKRTVMLKSSIESLESAFIR